MAQSWVASQYEKMVDPLETCLSSPEANSVSEKVDRSEEKMDTSDTPVSSERASSSPDSVDEPVKSFNANINNSIVEQDHPQRVRNTASTDSYGASETDSDLAMNYHTETVDFPDSPQKLKMMNSKSKDMHGFVVDDVVTEEDAKSDGTEQIEDQEIFTAAICEENVMQVQKGSIHSDDVDEPEAVRNSISEGSMCLSKSPYTDCVSSAPSGEYFDDSLISSEKANQLCSVPVTSALNYTYSLDQNPWSCDLQHNLSPLSLDLKHIHQLRNSSFGEPMESTPNFRKDTRVSLQHMLPEHYEKSENYSSEEPLSLSSIDASTIQKVKDCFDQSKIKDIYSISGRLQDLLSEEEIDQILQNSGIYSGIFSEDILEALSNVKTDLLMAQETQNGNVDHSPSNRVKISIQKEPLDETIMEHFDKELEITAVFERNNSFRNSKRRSPLPSKVQSTVELYAARKSHAINAMFEESAISGLETSHRKIIAEFNLEDELSGGSSEIEPIHAGPTAAIEEKNDVTFDIVASVENDSVKDINHQPEHNNMQKKPSVVLDVSVLELVRRPLHPAVVIQPGSSMSVSCSDTNADFSRRCHDIKKMNLNDSVQIASCHIAASGEETSAHITEDYRPPERPKTLNTSGKKMRKKILVNPDILSTDDQDDVKSLSSLSNRSEGEIFSPLDDIATPDDVETPDELDESYTDPPEPIPEISAAEERDEERRWRTCVISGVQRKIDMKVIEPYKKVLSHGGYYSAGRHAIIVFGACYLPDHSRKDYDYVMDNLFLYVLTTLDQLVAEDYILIYLHGAMDKGNMPTFGWLKRCYQMIDRRLRKNLKGLYLVHPTFWLKTLVLMTKPFISSKFARKLQFVHSLQELAELVPVDQICIPDKVKQLEFQMMIKEKKKLLKMRKGAIDYTASASLQKSCMYTAQSV